MKTVLCLTAQGIAVLLGGVLLIVGAGRFIIAIMTGSISDIIIVSLTIVVIALMYCLYQARENRRRVDALDKKVKELIDLVYSARNNGK